MPSRAEVRVQAGATFLDELMPDWTSRIDPERLSMASKDDCIIAQLFGSYETGVRRLGVCVSEARRFGFVGTDRVPSYRLD
jgi:hypothetical protein